MFTTLNHKPHHVPCDSSGRRLKRSSSFLIGQLIVALTCAPLASTLANAQSSSTCSSSSSSCVDLYSGTVSAMQAYGYQPSSLSSNTGQSISAGWAVQNFSGGTLNGSPMVFTLPSNQGEPTQTVLYSTNVYSCPGAGTVTGQIQVTVSMSDTTEISSDQQVENSSSTFMNASATVTIGYKPPSETGGVDGSVSGTYQWGMQSDTSTAASSGTANSTDTASTTALSYNYSVKEGYIQPVSVTSQTYSYSDVNWSSNITLTGTLTSVQYAQMFKSTQPPSLTSQNVAGTGIPANIWYPPTQWSSQNADVLASPSGAYAFFPNWTADLAGAFLKSTNNATLPYYQGQWYDTYGQGMILRLDTGPCSGGCAGTFWATNLQGSQTAWDSNQSPAYLAMQNDGNLVGYNTDNKAIWSSNSGQGIAVPPTAIANPVPQPNDLLPNNGQAFTATGQYSATTYTGQAVIGGGTPTRMTQDQLNQYCQPSQSASMSYPLAGKLYASTPETDAGYSLIKASNNEQIIVLAQQDSDRAREQNRDRRDLRSREAERMDRFPARENVENKANDAEVIDKAVNHNKTLGKLRKIKGPILLRKDQFYAAPLLGLKITKVTVKSDSLSNYMGFVPGPQTFSTETFSAGSRTEKVKVGKRQIFKVKPRANI